MAENNKLQRNSPTYDDVQAKDHFIGIALRALIEQQIALKQTGNYELVADHAVRYANAVMVSRSKTFAKTVATGGRGVPVQPQPIPLTPPTGELKPTEDITDLTKNLGEIVEYAANEGELPKNPVPSIAEQMAGAPPLAEVR